MKYVTTKYAESLKKVLPQRPAWGLNHRPQILGTQAAG